MRTLLFATAMLFSLAMPARAEEPRSYDASALPHTEEALRALDFKQLRIVQRTTNHCDATEPMLANVAGQQRPCVISGVDHAVDASDDPALQAYHAALPFNARYDRYRSSYYYQQILVRYRQ